MTTTITNDKLGKGLIVSDGDHANRVAGIVIIDPITGLPSALSGISSGLTDAQLRATAVPVSLASGNVTITGPITVSNEVEIKNDSGSPIPVLSTQLPASLGGKTAAQSISVVLSSDGPFATNIGMQADSAATTDTGSFSVISFIKRGMQNWTTLLAKLPASLGIKTSAASLSVAPASDALFSIASSETHIGVVTGLNAVVSATITRPADTTPYSALDVISNSTSAPVVMTFAGMSRINAGSAYIVKARLSTDQSTNIARFKLHLYHTAPTAINDNAQHTALWANRSKGIGNIIFDSCVTEGTGSDAAGALSKSERLVFTCDAGSTTIYGLLSTLDTFTPTSGQNFFVELTVEQQ